MARAHVETILAHDTVPASLREAVRRTGAWASFRPLSQALRNGISPRADAVVVIVPDDVRPVQHSLRVLFDRLADCPRAVLVVQPGGGLRPRLDHPASVPVTFGSALGADELASRLTTMLDMRPSLDSLHRGMLTNRRLEESATAAYERQLRLARQVQRELIPENLPSFGPVSFSALFRPTDYVSGDLYDIHRLDEEHVAIALADATGHGIPAALLTVFVKRALRGKEIHNGSYRLLPPSEVLERLNEELLEANLSECRFVAATYAVLNTRTLTLELARGGTPYPILRRRDGHLELLRPAGSVIGVLPGARFPVQQVQLARGDSLVICSDGIENVVAPQIPAAALAQTFLRAAAAVREGAARERRCCSPAVAHACWTACDDSGFFAAAGSATALADGPERSADSGLPEFPDASDEWRSTTVCGQSSTPLNAPALESASRRLAPDESVLASGWCATLRDDGPQAALEQLTVRYDSLRRMGCPLDDLTVLALQIRA
jgi:hypothetical protein